jgi:hypothetical protein
MARSIITGRFARTEDTLREIAERLITDMVAEIRARKKVASGELINSFDYDDAKIEELEIQITSDVDYAGVQDRGYQGLVPLENLVRWARIKGLRPRHKTGKKAGKFMSLEQFAWLAGRKIANQGYPGIDYVANAFLKSSNLIDKAIGESYAQDIQEMLEQNITFK